MADLGALEPVLLRTTRRIRLGRALAFLGHALTLGLALAAGHALWLRLRGEAPRPGLDLGLALGATALVCAVRFALRVRREEAAQRLDRAHDLHDRVRSAVEFAALRPEERTRFMEAALRDSLARAPGLSAERAVRFARPRGLAFALGPLAVWALVTLWPAAGAVAVTPRAEGRARVLDDDDLDAFRSDVRALSERAALTAEARADVTRYNALLEQLATGELDRQKALEALLSLEKKLLEQGGEQKADRAALEELARDLARADEALAQALSEPNEAERAAAALKKLAERAERGELGADEEKRLAEALERIRQREEEKKRQDERAGELEGLLKKKEESPPQEAAEKSLFDKQKRELERLRRDRAEAQKRSRQLERLSRDLADGAKPMNEGGQRGASESLARGAEDLRRYGQDKLTQEQRQELARQVQQLREMMQRQGGQGAGQKPQQGQGQGQGQGGDQASRTQRFRLRAQGQDPDGQGAQIVMKRPGQGQQGQGQQGQGQQGQGQQGQGQQGQGQQGQGQQGQGQQGQGQQAQGQQGQGQQGQGQQGPTTLELGGEGPATAVLELPELGGGGGVEQVQGEGAGEEHDARTLKAPTNLDAQHEDSRLTGTPGKGPTRSEVILDAADRGFATSSYRKVYTDYRSHAEDVLERDQVPPGYRFYVRRYFQLIRPRDRREAP